MNILIHKDRIRRTTWLDFLYSTSFQDLRMSRSGCRGVFPFRVMLWHKWTKPEMKLMEGWISRSICWNSRSSYDNDDSFVGRQEVGWQKNRFFSVATTNVSQQMLKKRIVSKQARIDWVGKPSHLFTSSLTLIMCSPCRQLASSPVWKSLQTWTFQVRLTMLSFFRFTIKIVKFYLNETWSFSSRFQIPEE